MLVHGFCFVCFESGCGDDNDNGSHLFEQYAGYKVNLGIGLEITL